MGFNSFLIIACVAVFIASYYYAKKQHASHGVGGCSRQPLALPKLGRWFQIYGTIMMILSGVGVVAAGRLIVLRWGSVNPRQELDLLMFFKGLKDFAGAWLWFLIGMSFRKEELWGWKFCVTAIVAMFFESSYVLFTGLSMSRIISTVAATVGFSGILYWLFRNPVVKGQFKSGRKDIPLSISVGLGLIVLIWLGGGIPTRESDSNSTATQSSIKTCGDFATRNQADSFNSHHALNSSRNACHEASEVL